jgi:hypothetical protein
MGAAAGAGKSIALNPDAHRQHRLARNPCIQAARRIALHDDFDRTHGGAGMPAGKNRTAAKLL